MLRVRSPCPPPKPQPLSPLSVWLLFDRLRKDFGLPPNPHPRPRWGETWEDPSPFPRSR